VRKDCLDCHQAFADKYFKLKSVHPAVKEKECEKCHLRHGIVPRLILKKQGNQMCYTCHEKEKIGLGKSVVHTALKREQCISCHNPHASQASHLLGAEGSEFCYQCHKQANYERQVVHKVLIEKPCGTCHLAHSSDEAYLLKTNDITLCLSCHESNEAAFKKAHAGYPVETASCNSCHNPHSSSQPKLLKTSVHPKVVKVACENCHNSPTSQNPLETTEKGSKLCYQCHKPSDLKAGGDMEHVPFQQGKCNSCHNPHDNTFTNFLVESNASSALCLRCHIQ
jgi:predicted CXXCH cytochrome family protein